MLVDMTTTHVPVLAGELIELLDPQPGEIAVDCTFGGGGHARLVAERLGPGRRRSSPSTATPSAEERFAELAAEVAVPHALHPRAVRRRRSSELRDEGVRADLVYLDLGMSSMQVDTRERGFSYAYDAPLDMRMDPDQELDRAPTSSTTWDERRLARAAARATARSATPARSPARSSARAPRRRSRRPTSSSRSSPPRSRARALRRRPPGQARLPGHPHRGQRRARPARRGAARSPGSCCASDGRFAGISFHSLEDRRVKRFLADRARGCICPPDLPVCVCGREPGGRAAHPPRGRAHARRGRRQPPRAVRPAARRTQARGDPA